MERERVLLSIADTGENIHVAFNTNGVKDMFIVSTSLIQLMKTHPQLLISMMAIRSILKEHPEIEEKLDESSVDMSEFEKILRNE